LHCSAPARWLNRPWRAGKSVQQGLTITRSFAYTLVIVIGCAIGAFCANGICNTLGRGATVISPFVVGFLMVNYGLPGVIWLMIGLVVIQIVVVWLWGVEPAKRGLEEVAVAKA
jgi:hypothetical protein